MLVIFATAASALAQQMGQWGRDDRLYSQGRATGVCRASRPGDPTAYSVFSCNDRNRTPLYRIDLRQAKTTGWVYGQILTGTGGGNFRYRLQGDVLPGVNDWSFYHQGAWQTYAQLQAQAAAATAAAPPSTGYIVGGGGSTAGSGVVGGGGSTAGSGVVGGVSSPDVSPEMAAILAKQAAAEARQIEKLLSPGAGSFPSN